MPEYVYIRLFIKLLFVDVNVDSIPEGVLTRSDLIDIATKDKEDEDDEEFPSENRE